MLLAGNKALDSSRDSHKCGTNQADRSSISCCYALQNNFTRGYWDVLFRDNNESQLDLRNRNVILPYVFVFICLFVCLFIVFLFTLIIASVKRGRRLLGRRKKRRKSWGRKKPELKRHLSFGILRFSNPSLRDFRSLHIISHTRISCSLL